MKKKKFNCPAELTLSLIGGKWRAILLYNLRKKPHRFGDLKRHSPGITPAVLTKELRFLETAGLVRRRKIGPDRADGVEYALTERGETLKPSLYSLIRWGRAQQAEYVDGPFGMAVFEKE
jgi:DNA-binding HxlR family transcriptional regulator